MSVNGLFGTSKSEEEGYWISVSDLMSGLMIIFLFIALSYMRDVALERDKIKEVAVKYTETQVDLYEALFVEFKHDLKQWNAEIDQKTLSVRFREPDILFGIGEASLKPGFKEILMDFFQRYLKILNLKQFKDNIEEVRIEGHTSSEWRNGISKDEAYFFNMRLSQDRTRAVLEFCLSLKEVEIYRKWAKSTITANGLSSSKVIYNDDIEDKERSRRVEFRVRTNAEEQIVKILQGG